MTTFNSISDLARTYQLRLSQSAMKSRLASVSQEATSGIKADISLALGGDLDRISQIENRLSVLKNYANNLSEAQGNLTGVQAALGSIMSTASGTGAALLSDTLVSSPSSLGVYLTKAPDDLKAALNALNTSVGGRFVFSGTQTDRPAVVSYEELMQQIQTAVSTASTATTIMAQIDAYFDPNLPGGFSDLAFTGSDQGTSAIAVSVGKTIAPSITANAMELRDSLKGFAVLAFLAESPGLDHNTKRDLSRAAGQKLISGEIGVTAARTQLGVQQETAAKEQTAQETERSALAIARNALITTDPYEAATAMTELEANLETLYAVTSRLSRLSLTDYL